MNEPLSLGAPFSCLNTWEAELETHEAARGASKGLLPLIRPHQFVLILSPHWGQGVPVTPGVQPLPKSPGCILPGAPVRAQSSAWESIRRWPGESRTPPSSPLHRNIPMHSQRPCWKQGRSRAVPGQGGQRATGPWACPRRPPQPRSSHPSPWPSWCPAGD